jgi:hypothetical protein
MIPIISSRPDGLGTRLLSILHGLRFAEQTGASFSIGWPSLDDANYPIQRRLLQAETADEIFNIEQPIQGRSDVFFLDRSYWIGRRCCMVHGALSHLDGSSLTLIEEFCSDFDVMIYDLPAPISVAGNIHTIETRIIKQNWKRLAFSQLVRDTFTSFALDSKLSSSVAIHVRRGDVVKMLCEGTIEHLIQSGGTQIFQRYVATKTIVNALTPLLPLSASVVVCSEDRSAAQQIAECLPGTTVYSSFGLFPQDSNQAALLDLMILAGARWLMSPFKSYFSECASAVGECESFNIGLDVQNLVDDLIFILEHEAVKNRDERRAIVYALGYLNLWHQPGSAYRQELRCLARAADSAVADLLIKSQ